MDEKQDLIDALKAAGAIDTNVAQLARTDISVAAAVLDLRGRYPAAFTPPFDARTAPQAEVDKNWKHLLENNDREALRRRTEAAIAETQCRFGGQK